MLLLLRQEKVRPDFEFFSANLSDLCHFFFCNPLPCKGIMLGSDSKVQKKQSLKHMPYLTYNFHSEICEMFMIMFAWMFLAVILP